MVLADETSQFLSSNSTPCCSEGSDEALHDVHAALSKMVALFFVFRMLEDDDATLSPQPPSLLGKSENGWLVVKRQGGCLTAQPNQATGHTLCNSWCSSALSRNCHRQSKPILRLSPYEDRVAPLICRIIRVIRLEDPSPHTRTCGCPKPPREIAFPSNCTRSEPS